MKDVAVVGAGPAGLHTAYRLASAGLDVVLLEAQSRIGERAICSGVIGDEAFTRFGLPSRSVLGHIYCIQALSPKGTELEHRTTSPLARVVDKGEFNRDLARLASGAGVEIRLGRFVESLEREKCSVSLRFCSLEGSKGTLKARLAVITTGVNGSLNSALGLARPRRFLRALQVEMELRNGSKPAPTRVYVGRAVAPGAFAWVIPLGNGRARVGLMAENDPETYFVNFLHRVAPAADVPATRIDRKGIAQLPEGPCTTDRVMAVGEAAGHVKTTTGGGIYYGLLSAEFAAEVIVRAFRKGDLSSNALSDFERYWRTAFGNELLVGYFARRLVAHLSDNQIESVFGFVRATDLLVRLDGRLRFDWHHRAILATLRSLLAVPSSFGVT
jgi:geranylgeranyl reductase family protein